MAVEMTVKWKETGRNEGLIDNCRLCIGSFCDVILVLSSCADLNKQEAL